MQAEARPWQADGNVDPLDRRRRELFRLAAPVFREHGYRGATIKALAYACHLTPAGLYHYFASKADLATYVVRQPRMDWRGVYVDPDREPIVQLSEFLDLAIQRTPRFPARPGPRGRALGSGCHAHPLGGMFKEGETIFGRYLAAVRPGLTPIDARELARLVLALLVGSHEIGGGTQSRCAPWSGPGSSACSRAELVPDGRGLRPGSTGPWRAVEHAENRIESVRGFGATGRNAGAHAFPFPGAHQ